MLKWQSEIFRGELAETIRCEYRYLLAAGVCDEEAERLILAHCMEDIVPESAEEGRVWLALSLRQWELGRLSANVKAKALDWATRDIPGISETARKELADHISLPNPKKKRVPKPSWVKKCPWSVGSLLAYRIVSCDLECVKSSPFWEKYVLLRIIKINRTPVTYLAPEKAWSESMLVGLYNWCGTTIPDASIACELEYTPISICEAQPHIKNLFLSFAKTEPILDSNLCNAAASNLFDGRIETCNCLDWTCKNHSRDEIFTYLGCDSAYKDSIPAGFMTDITQYAINGTEAFDIALVNRLKQLTDIGTLVLQNEL